MNIRPSILLLALLAAGCASVSGTPTAARPNDVPVASQVLGATQPTPAREQGHSDSMKTPTSAESSKDKAHESQAEDKKTWLFPGSGQFLKSDVAPKVDPVLVSGERVSLNFENVNVGSLAAALLGDLLRLNYTIDAGGDTVVSLHTRQPLLRSQVLDVLDAVLLPHDLAIVRDNAGVYHVTKRTATVGSRPLVSASKFKDLTGSGTVIVPLNHIAAAEMAKILAPLAPRESIVYVDGLRNLLVLQGSKAQLGGWLEMVDAFDVDFLAGMSLGVFVLENANVNVVRDAIQTMLGSSSDSGLDISGGKTAAMPTGASTTNRQGFSLGSATVGNATSNGENGGAYPLFGLIRLFPVERLNALVVVTPRAHLLPQVETWVRRLDSPSNTTEPQLFVYPVQNSSAVHLAEMLNGLFSGQASTAKAGVAAGAAPTQFSTTGAGATGQSTPGANAATGFGALGAQLPNAGSNAAQEPLTTTVQLEGGVKVVADDKRNALLIRAPRTEYRRIEKALRELDRAPTQVLIEASIVEVGLTGDLKYGVEWFVENTLKGERSGIASLITDAKNPFAGVAGSTLSRPNGFSYSISNKAGLVRATLQALASTSQLRVLSNPSILVLDNHSATILVGKQQPIKQSTTTNGLSTNTIENFVLKDTGVMLTVTPSVNAGGLVSMNISQQVTSVGEIDGPTGQYNFLTRQIQTRVAVRSGEPVVLGGVMSETESTLNSGVPGLRDVPLLGALFSTNNNERARTELLVMLTPRVLEDDDALREASAELRDRMRSLTRQTNLTPLPMLEGAATKPAQAAHTGTPAP